MFHLIEKKTTEKLTPDVDQVHVTDAEGADLRWDVTLEMAKRWLESRYDPSHLLMYPDSATGKYGWQIDNYPTLNEQWTPREPIALAHGVIAGTNGSGGFWPRMEITLKDGYITSVKGGGIYGDVIREFMQYPHINDVTYPYYDKPGYWHLWEMALGTQPKNFRDPSDFYGGGHSGIYCLTFERYRSGVVHWGFGNEIPSEAGSVGQPARWLKFGADHGLPTGHDFHIQNYFIVWALAAAGGIGVLFWVIGVHLARTLGAVLPVWLFRLMGAVARPLLVQQPHHRTALRRGNTWLPLVSASLLDTTALVSNNLGLATEQVSVVSVLSSLYGAVTLILARIFLEERLIRRQWLGIGLIAIGVALVSV